MAMAKELSVKQIDMPTNGNAGAALATYAAHEADSRDARPLLPRTVAAQPGAGHLVRSRYKPTCEIEVEARRHVARCQARQREQGRTGSAENRYPHHAVQYGRNSIPLPTGHANHLARR
jgi:hypothetical protein